MRTRGPAGGAGSPVISLILLRPQSFFGEVRTTTHWAPHLYRTQNFPEYRGFSGHSASRALCARNFLFRSFCCSPPGMRVFGVFGINTLLVLYGATVFLIFDKAIPPVFLSFKPATLLVLLIFKPAAWPVWTVCCTNRWPFSCNLVLHLGCCIALLRITM